MFVSFTRRIASSRVHFRSRLAARASATRVDARGGSDELLLVCISYGARTTDQKSDNKSDSVREKTITTGKMEWSEADGRKYKRDRARAEESERVR